MSLREELGNIRGRIDSEQLRPNGTIIDATDNPYEYGSELMMRLIQINPTYYVIILPSVLYWGLSYLSNLYICIYI